MRQRSHSLGMKGFLIFRLREVPRVEASLVILALQKVEKSFACDITIGIVIDNKNSPLASD